MFSTQPFGWRNRAGMVSSGGGISAAATPSGAIATTAAATSVGTSECNPATATSVATTSSGTEASCGCCASLPAALWCDVRGDEGPFWRKRRRDAASLSMALAGRCRHRCESGIRRAARAPDSWQRHWKVWIVRVVNPHVYHMFTTCLPHVCHIRTTLAQIWHKSGVKTGINLANAW